MLVLWSYVLESYTNAFDHKQFHSFKRALLDLTLVDANMTLIWTCTLILEQLQSCSMYLDLWVLILIEILYYICICTCTKRAAKLRPIVKSAIYCFSWSFARYCCIQNCVCLSQSWFKMQKPRLIVSLFIGKAKCWIDCWN